LGPDDVVGVGGGRLEGGRAGFSLFGGEVSGLGVDFCTLGFGL
jgi:hypothetical protein